MCSNFIKMMDNYEGDLSDIVRAAAPETRSQEAGATPEWQFSRNSINYSPEYFGDPFTYIKDPLNQTITPPISEHLYNSSIGGVISCDGVKRPSNIFSRMLQISPNAKPCENQDKNPPILVSNNGGLISGSSSALQISSPPNTGTKRRKSQAKKVVCIPAPAPANSRATGEVVPSDLWAWRKYGQKPIKGSPYPRGYYRCSSSKGCSARKQVERSRTDPNMLVITYTSEHNHPWPTQRNALAGSTRSQPAKGVKEEADRKETASPIQTNCKEEADHRFEPQFEPDTYKPTQEQDSFFADLGEIGDDPLSLFGQGFPPADHTNNNHSDLDPFSFYDWTTTTAEDSSPKS
ncbi:hypothetical protein SASPL_113978 [Salvia splendens]|uniref:WRKY domain-containing protein n=1 Tax=Salvia splendens TaxID=180675 RepID=A0A8X8Y3T7_SALSN|nr:probable WRKY transcription factor 14 [Salvia splendens]KAG6423577.1 hypothetical protein SASPL_113978 [Salvia splendens]